MAGRIRLVERTSPNRRCGYCHGGAGALDTCQECAALTHADCRTELGRCPTLGCREVVARRPATEQVHVSRRVLAPLYVTAAGHALLLLFAGAAVVALGAHLAPGRGWDWLGGPVSRWQIAAAVATLFGVPLSLGVTLPWLWRFPARLERLDALRRAPRPRRAALHVERVPSEDGGLPLLVLTPTGSRRQLTFQLQATLLPRWLRQLRSQEVTIYGDTDDPLLLELSDGRLALLFQG